MSVRTIHWDEPFGPECHGGAVTVGNFDGVHCGHQALLGELRRQAEKVGGPAVVLTFDPHPLQLLRPQDFPPILTTLGYRAELLRRHGADCVLILQTTWDLLNLTAREFFDSVLLGKIRPQVVVPGFNFHFGKNREGTVEKLREFCHQAGKEFVMVSRAIVGGGAVSSSRIRAELQAGRVRQAADLLGRPYRLTGTVVAGQRRGRTIGFPTANLEGVETLLPAVGVYAVTAEVDGEPRPAAANVGPNPTFGEQARKIEVHVIGFDGDLYGRTLAVDFVERLRDTRPFAGAGELVEQLHRDIDQAREILAARTG